MSVLIMALALLAVAGTWAASSARAASGVQVFVGYADSLRPNPVNFPTPWDGSPNTAFEGCHPNPDCTFDGSAVRIVNNTSAPVTVNSVSVKFSTCTIAIWPSNVVLAVGAEEILTQENVKSMGACDPAQGEIDGSEIGPGGKSWDFNCTQSNVIPQVVTDIDGTTTTTADSAKTLNTGGVDSATCNPPVTEHSQLHNESIPWKPIGKICTAGNTLSLAPPTQTHFVGQTAKITATFDDGCGAALSNTPIKFHDLSGPDATLTGAGTTDANGQASFTYTGHIVGTDTWDATETNPAAGTLTSNDVNVIWKSNTQVNTGQKITVHDVADIGGFLSGGTGGTVDFRLFSTSGCTGSPVFDSGPRPVDTSNGTANSGTSANPGFPLPFTNTNTTYNWVATYSGDAINGTAVSKCGTESFSVAGNSLPSGVDP